jgi:hypothetical protein
MLAGWCLVLWGSVVLLATLWALVTQGRVTALGHFARLSPVNQVLAIAAFVVWGLVAWSLYDARRARASESG